MCKKILLFSFFIMAINFSIGSAQQNILPEIPDNFEAISFLGKGISSPEPSASALEKLETAKVKYMDYPMDPENVIWYGRRLAYAGKIRESIKIFSEGILDFPKDPRFYRHRGHRYISIRDLDRAIADLKKRAS
jgi:tetratricopeptide (TPR) repeat protein